MINKKKLLISILCTVLITSAIPLLMLEAREAPRRGGTFVTALFSDPATLNKLLTTSVAPSFSSIPVFSTLIRIDTEFNPQPNLAESWVTSADGLTITINLHHGVTFHDGEPLTSEDVLFTFSEEVSSESPTYANWAPFVDDISAPDDYTVVFKLNTPLPYFIQFAGYYIPILPKHLYEGTDIRTNEYNSKPIGSGPFKFVEWVKGDHITYERNENFFLKDEFGNQLPYLDEVIMPIIPDTTTRILALESGEVDYLSGFSFTATEWQRMATDPDYTVTFLEYHGTALQYIIFNLRREPFDNVELRQALTHGIDKKVYLDNVFYGAGAVVESNCPSAWSYYLDPDAKQPAYDPEKAKELLDDLGYNKDNPLTIECVFDVGRDDQTKVSEIFQSQMADIDVNVELVGLEAGVIPDILGQNFDFDVHVVSIANPQDVILPMIRSLHSQNNIPGYIRNLAGYENPEMDAALDGAISTPYPEDRKPYVMKVQELFARDIPMISLYEKNNPSCYRNDRIGGGLGEEPGGSRLGYSGGNNFMYVWLLDGEPIEPIYEPDETVTGETGEQGPPGPQGPPGAQGPAGKDAPTTYLYISILLSLVAVVFSYFVYTKK